MKLTGPAWIENVLEKKAERQMIPGKRQKYPSLMPQKGPEDTSTITILPITIRPFQKNVSGKKTLFISHAKTEHEVRSLTTWKALPFQECYTAMSPQSLPSFSSRQLPHQYHRVCWVCLPFGILARAQRRRHCSTSVLFVILHSGIVFYNNFV